MFNTFDTATSQTQERFAHALQKLRTGRAHPSLVTDISVEAYGAQTPLAGLAHVSIGDARMLVIEPFDASVTKDIEKAIIAAGLNVSPVVDGKIIRLHLPELTQETRAQLVKKLKEHLEDARIATRRAREELKKQIEKDTKSGALTEDDRRDAIAQLDEKTKQAIEELEKRATHKEDEIMTL